MTVVCNARVLNAPLTGIQRYTQELLSRLPEIETVRPKSRLPGIVGHSWEQGILPLKTKGKTLWSPSNTGPICVKNQIVTVHDLATFDTPEGFSSSFRAAYSFILPRLLPRVRAIITVSDFSRQCIIERFGLPAEKIFVTPLGVEHERFKPRSETEIDAVKQKLQIESRYVLFLGALSARKNVAGLIKAWNMAQKELPDDMELLIAGGAGASHVFDGTTLPQLPEGARLLPRIEDSDLPALLSGATLFAFPSNYEGFGLPALEAMACGTPVLTSNITSLPEVVGDTAYTVNPHNTDDIAQGLVTLLNNDVLCSSLAGSGKARAKQFTWEKTAALTRNILEQAG